MCIFATLCVYLIYTYIHALHLVAFCNKIFIRKFVRFIRINGGFVRLHCINACVLYLPLSVRGSYSLIRLFSALIRLKRIIRRQTEIEQGTGTTICFGDGMCVFHFASIRNEMQSICGCKYKRMPVNP